MASKRQQVDPESSLLPIQRSTTQFLEAARDGNTVLVRSWLAKMCATPHFDVNAPVWFYGDQWGTLLIHVAIHSQWPNHAPTVLALLEAKANVHLCTFSNETPLHLVSAADSAHLLVQHGAELNAKTQSGETPLMKAAKNERSGSAAVVRVLLEAKADANLEDQWQENRSGPIYYSHALRRCQHAPAKAPFIEAAWRQQLFGVLAHHLTKDTAGVVVAFLVAAPDAALCTCCDCITNRRGRYGPP